jgi:hypothetical protein
MDMGDEIKVNNCLIIEADMDALALLDKLRDVGAEKLVLFGPLHREGRKPGVYERNVQPEKRSVNGKNASDIVKTLWPNLTGSLKLCHYEDALKILSNKPFKIAECEPGGKGCYDIFIRWLESACGTR